MLMLFHPNCMLIMKLKCVFQQQNSFPNKTSSLIRLLNDMVTAEEVNCRRMKWHV